MQRRSSTKTNSDTVCANAAEKIMNISKLYQALDEVAEEESNFVDWSEHTEDAVISL
jgi:hypothetical protein